MNNIFKNSIILSLTEIFLIGLAVFRLKIVAVKIGPEGLGIYGLLNSFFAILMVISASWMSSVIVKYVSEYQSRKDYISMNNIINISILTSSVLRLILIFFSIVYKEYLIKIFFNSEMDLFYYSIFSISCLGFSLKMVFSSLLQGLIDVITTVKYRIITSVLEIFITIILVIKFQIAGFILSFFVSSLIHVWYLISFLKYTN